MQAAGGRRDERQNAAQPLTVRSFSTATFLFAPQAGFRTWRFIHMQHHLAPMRALAMLEQIDSLPLPEGRPPLIVLTFDGGSKQGDGET